MNTAGDADEEFETLADEVVVVEADPVELFCTVLPLAVVLPGEATEVVVPADTGDVVGPAGDVEAKMLEKMTSSSDVRLLKKLWASGGRRAKALLSSASP